MKPIDRAWLSLEGLSVGDAFGERFFGPTDRARFMLEERAVFSPEGGSRTSSFDCAEGLWKYTDDTEMAISIVEQLEDSSAILQDQLAEKFADHMNPARGYGSGAYKILTSILEGTHWRKASAESFGGKGSLGNGAAMRVAPLGAFFADDVERCVREARFSAEITHMHEEGIAGAIAVAVAAALTWRRNGSELPNGRDWLARVHDIVPKGLVKERIALALRIPASTSAYDAGVLLGNGANVTAHDTVAFCLWIATWYSHDFREALWQTASAFGDMDTTCAIVGGIISLQGSPIPREWLYARERLPPRFD